MSAGSTYGNVLAAASARNVRARASRGAPEKTAIATIAYRTADVIPEKASNAVADVFIARYYVAHAIAGLVGPDGIRLRGGRDGRGAAEGRPDRAAGSRA